MCRYPQREDGFRRRQRVRSAAEYAIRRGLTFVTVAVTVLLTTSLPMARGESVLLLNSYHQGMAWTDAITSGVASVLSGHDLRVEYLDAKRHIDARYLELMRGLLFKKYQGRPPRVIVSSDDHALAFLLEHRGTLFPEVPVVFCGVNDYSESLLDGHERITGVVEAFDIRQTVDMALRLHPSCQQLIIINDTTKTGRANRRVIERLLPDVSQHVDVTFLEDVTMSDLLTQIGALPASSLVLLMSFNRDAAGQVFDYDASIGHIAQACKVPMYGIWDFYLGKGIVGGMLTNGRAQGELAAAMALQILDGARPDDIPVVTQSPNRWMFDHRQLVRHHIDESQLPDGSVIANRPRSLYQDYRTQIWSTVSAFAALVLLSLFLIFNIQKRRGIEKDLLESQQLILGVTSNIPGVVYQFFADADKRFGFRFISEKAIDLFGLQPSLETFFDDFCRCIPNEDVQAFINSIDTAVERCTPWHYQGRFIRPDSGATIWFSGNSIPHREGDMIVFDGVLMDITAAKTTEQKLRRSERQMAQIIDFLPDPTFVIDTHSRVIAWNRAMEDLTGVDAETMIGKGDYEYAIPFYGSRRPVMIDLVRDWNEKTAKQYNHVQQKGDRLFSETKAPHRPIGNRHYKNTAGPLYDEQGNVVGAIETIHDITERRAAEAAVAELHATTQKSLAFIQALLSAIPNPVFYKDIQGRYLGCNQAFADLMGVTEDDIQGKTVHELWPSEKAAQYHRKDLELIAHPGRQVYESSVTDRDGRERQVILAKDIFYDDQGKVAGIVAAFTDITDLRQAEANLLLMELVVKNSPVVLFRWLAADNWPVAYVSDNVDQFGYSADDLIAGRVSFAAMVHADDLSRVAQEVREYTRQGVTHFQQEYRIVTPSGGVRWVDDRTLIERNAVGEVTHYQGVVLDITDRKNAQIETTQRQQFLESVLYHAPDAVITLDAQHRVMEWNPGAEKIFGYRRNEVIGRELDELVTQGEVRMEADRKRDSLLAGRRVEAFETVRYRKDGSPVSVIAAGSPILIDGRLTGVVAMYTDISALKTAEDKIKRSERMLRRIMDIVPSMIFVKNSRGRFIMANQTMADSYGIPVEDLIGKSHAQVHPDPDQAQQMLADDRRALEAGRPIFIPEEPYQDVNGATRWLEVIKVPCDASVFGEPAIVGLATDITERRAIEARIQESEKRYRTIFENTGTGTVLSEADTTLSMVNSEFTAMVGYSREEIEGRMSWTRFIVPEDVERMKTYHHDRRKDPSSAPAQWECGLVDRQGRVKRMLLKVRLIPGTQTSVGAFLDISDRKQAEEAIVAANRMLRLVLDTIPVRVFWKNRACRYLGCNQPFAEDAGRSDPEELIGKDDYTMTWVDQADLYRKDDLMVMKTGQARIDYEEPQTTPDGRTIWLQTSKVPMRDGQGNIIGVLGTYQDITARKTADEEVRRLRNYLSNIINSMPSILVGVDLDGHVTQWNKQAELITGKPFEAVQSQPLAAVFPQLIDEMERIRTAIRDRRVLRDPKVPRRTNGDTRFEDVTIFPLVANGVEGAVIRVDDVTERVRLEEMMIQSEKMLSVGGLAAGMAHEINNPLAGILQNAVVLENRLFGDLAANRDAAEAAGTTSAAIQRYLELRKLPTMLSNIRTSGNRAATIVKNMLSFARKSDSVISSHDLATLMEQTIELAQTDYDMKKRYDFKKIEIVRKYANNAAPVPCEASKIQQVFLNILKNGAEAMAAMKSAQERPRFIIRVAADGHWVRVEIEDNGPGMDVETRRRIFEPFFTTKPVGEGTGLGLSVSYFIITENHRGKMNVQAPQSGGTRFVIRLPKTGKP